MSSSRSRKLPVFLKGEIAGWTVIDADVYEWAQDYDWCLRARGYAGTGNRRRGHELETGGEVLLHRLILGLTYHDGKQSDHINRKRLDNRRANLRIVTQKQNLQNREISTATSSVYRGVALHPAGAWHVQVMVDGVQHKLGSYLCEHIAGIVAERGRRALHTHAQPCTALRGRRLLHFVDLDGLTCGGCASFVPFGKPLRYWRIIRRQPMCSVCTGYIPPLKRDRTKPPEPCCHCGRLSDHRDHSRCPTCAKYLRRHGVDRPPELVNGTRAKKAAFKRYEPTSERPCEHCARMSKLLTRRRCGACYRYLRIYGIDRPPELVARTA